MAQVYVFLIKKGLKTIDDVPVTLKAEVRDCLALVDELAQ